MLLLPVRDRLTSQRAELAVAASRPEAEEGQRHLQASAVDIRQMKRGLAVFRIPFASRSVT